MRFALGIALFVSILIVVLALLTYLLLRFANRSWWRLKLTRTSLIVAIALGLAAAVVFGFGIANNDRTLAAIGGTSVSFITILLACNVVSLPVSGLVRAAGKWFMKTDEVDHSRRRFLQGTALAFPVVTTGAGLTGFATSFGGVKLYELPVTYKNLPADLDGFRILHLSDLHLGRYFGLPDLEALVQEAIALKPDLVLVTGDFCDLVPQLYDSIRILSELNAPYGTFASIGNHEYYHGVHHSRRAHESSDIPLLIDLGTKVKVGNASLFVGGADDPRRMGEDISAFLERTVDKTLAYARSDDFKIVMSHRPTGFDATASQGVDLTLAGHTHGGQLGFRGRSIFESTDPPNYFWGHYVKGESQLYTSAGVGHWFPFRLGCPSEAPLIILKSAQLG